MFQQYKNLAVNLHYDENSQTYHGEAIKLTPTSNHFGHFEVIKKISNCKSKDEFYDEAVKAYKQKNSDK